MPAVRGALADRTYPRVPRGAVSERPGLVTELLEVLGRADAATLEKLFGSPSTPVNTPLFTARRRSRRQLPTCRLLSCSQSAVRSGRSLGFRRLAPCRAKMARARLPRLAAASISTPCGRNHPDAGRRARAKLSGRFANVISGAIGSSCPYMTAGRAYDVGKAALIRMAMQIGQYRSTNPLVSCVGGGACADNLRSFSS
jgi:NAD(P)-dependent dehydrogenase (short-subunit alcohol dehydrogenase family)